ncbi:2-keto-4-pentenoate hydratase [Labrys miyagiensis]
MTTAFDPEAAASLLADTWRGGEALPGFSPGLRPATLAQGYAVQEAFVARLGGPVVGWKLGGGSPAGKRQNGLTVPLIGQIVASRSLKSGDLAPRTNGRPLVVEFEIAFVVDEDVEAGALQALPGRISAHASFELVQSRYADRTKASVPETVADNAFAHAIVLGEALDIGDLGAIVADVAVEVDGVEQARGLAGEDLVDPLAALHEFIDHARRRELSLRRGNVILTGTLTRPFETPEGAGRITARSIGKAVTVRI